MSRQETGTCPQLVVDPSKLTHVEKLSPNISFSHFGRNCAKKLLQKWGKYLKKGKEQMIRRQTGIQKLFVSFLPFVCDTCFLSR